MDYIKPVFKCLDIYKEQFNSSQCLLTISVGQEVHEEKKLKATIELVNSTFKSAILLIDDSLQRHTMALTSKSDAESFYEFSIKLGDEWLSRNEEYYKKLTILKKVIRWDEWLNHPYYSINQNLIKSTIETDCTYKNAFDITIDEFLKRYYQRLIDKEDFDIKRARLLCLDYLIEECTAMCLWPEMGCQFEVYPSPRNLAMQETHKRFVLPKYPDLLHAVAIKFKNRNQFKPQYLELLNNQAENLEMIGSC